mmetsp:Transcript_73824/g.207303  ORF Transcript_73824/g.207303 Transcript_73824/m.207303 type:complete len:244 (+) Transcript_73824:727-1458(+)
MVAVAHDLDEHLWLYKRKPEAHHGREVEAEGLAQHHGLRHQGLRLRQQVDLMAGRQALRQRGVDIDGHPILKPAAIGRGAHLELPRRRVEKGLEALGVQAAHRSVELRHTVAHLPEGRRREDASHVRAVGVRLLGFVAGGRGGGLARRCTAIRVGIPRRAAPRLAAPRLLGRHVETTTDIARATRGIRGGSALAARRGRRSGGCLAPRLQAGDRLREDLFRTQDVVAPAREKILGALQRRRDN